MNLVFLHGFLGEGNDFSSLIQELKEQFSRQFVCLAPNYYQIPSLSPRVSWQQWPGNFQEYLEAQNWNPGARILVGYSQGGRLALNYLRQFESLHFFEAVILISAGIGIEDSEKPQRGIQDQQWVQKFLHRDLAGVIEEWNAQSVFVGSRMEPQRTFRELDPDLLATNLTEWSVAQDRQYSEFLATHKNPILYLSGEFDGKYRHYGEILHQKNSLIQNDVIEGTGHRCFLDNPQMTAQAMVKFFEQNGF